MSGKSPEEYPIQLVRTMLVANQSKVTTIPKLQQTKKAKVDKP